MKFRPAQYSPDKGLQITSSPFTHNPQNKTSNIMLWVIVACIPGILAQIYYFGYGNLIQIAIAIITALIAESTVLSLRKRPIFTQIRDNSALLTGLLLAISLPPLAPWWIIVLGTTFSIVVAKQLYGGLGHNPFNPAMVGYVVLLVSFPVQMTCWLLPMNLQLAPISFFDTLLIILTDNIQNYSPYSLPQNIDAVSQATPLDAFKTGLRSQSAIQVLQQPLFSDVLATHGWQWINAGFLVGGLLLLWRKIIYWYIPVSFLLSLTVCTTISWLVAPENSAPPLLHLFSGATMLGAFFIATDPVSAATTPKGRLIFGGLIGLLVWLIRVYGGYPDAVAFAVLLANIAVPLIDHYTQPRVHGH